MTAMDSTSIRVELPKFKLEYTRGLNDDLTALGMGVAFEDGAADFRNLFEPNEPGPYITGVAHRTFLEINEEGTEAAAVTSVGVGVVSLPPTFSVDRPFLLAIRERFSGTVLFVGKILRVPE
jgi:serine protease inhibitor